EDVEDELGAVDHALGELALEVLALGGRELIVEDDERSVLLGDELLELVDLAAPDVGRGIGAVELLRERADDDGTGGVGEAGELLEVLSDVMAGVAALDGRADEDGAFLGRREIDERSAHGIPSTRPRPE